MDSTEERMMTKNRKGLLSALLVSLSILFFNNCSQSNSSGLSQVIPEVSISANAPGLTIVGNEANILSISVGCQYANEPCVTVIVCKPGTSTCVSIGNVLLDTGSYGLRLFSSTLSSLGLAQEKDASGSGLAECQSYADGSSDWGPLVRADVILGGETASNIPIQSIDSSFGSAPSDCKDLDTDPLSSGFNGILGVGQLQYDCGTLCSAHANNRTYFHCAAGSSSCNTSIAVPLSYQLKNPVAAFPVDNNGVILQLPAIPGVGAGTVTGWLVFGIGTQANNVPPTGVVTFPASTSTGDFLTIFNSTTYPAFIDSGSNGLYFPTPSNLTVCADLPGFFCPANPPVLSATQTGISGTPSQTIQFAVQNADIALSSSNSYNVFNNLAGPFTGEFDWGLPFFLGRTIYVGFESAGTPIGTGPFWAY